MAGRDQAAVVGVGASEYFKRGRSQPRTRLELAGTAILRAVADAGLTVKDVDGFAYFAGGMDTGGLAQTLGIPEIRFSATLTGGGSGCAGSVGLAAMAVATGQAEVVVVVISAQQPAAHRFGAVFAGAAPGDLSEFDFLRPYGLVAPGQMFALLAQRHMHQYGTTREQLGAVAIAHRRHASTRETALFREPLTMEDYLAARMISEPLCLLDYTMESDGAVAVIVTSLERARDLRHAPVVVAAGAQAGDGRWGQGTHWLGMPEELFATAGQAVTARLLYERSGIGPADVDVALLYDHFTPMVLMQLEDFGFCARGEGGPFVEDGNIDWPAGSLPVNPHGGNLSEAYILGFTHVKEAVEQIRGDAVNQVDGAQVALVTGGPSTIPVSALLLRAA